MSNHLLILRGTLVLLMWMSVGMRSFADGGLNTYYKVGTYDGTMNEAAEMVKAALTTGDAPFEILGDYEPAKLGEMRVIVFTRGDLVEICSRWADMSLMASVLRIGLYQTGAGKVEVSLLNPDYVFYAFLRERYAEVATDLASISIDVRVALFGIGQEFRPFGGSATERELMSYQFTVSMPGFNEPVVLGRFGSFAEAVERIGANLRSRRGNSLQVFQQVLPDKQVAVFGVALHDARWGEAYFLPLLGPENLANMPYEIVVVGTEVRMLHGRYRLPLFWSGVSIRQHQRLYKTPRDIEEALRGLTLP
jgi:hypothetical protein